MCFVVLYSARRHLVQASMQIDDGASAYEFARQHGYSVRLWEMYGMTHFSELPQSTKDEIKEFIKGLK